MKLLSIFVQVKLSITPPLLLSFFFVQSWPPPSKPLNVELTIVSAKHLKNVNWHSGDLKSYAVFWIDPERRLSTRSDDSGSTRPVWNERFTLPLTVPLRDAVFTLEIFHSKPSETSKPLVGTLRVELGTFRTRRIRPGSGISPLLLPSGRPQGKIRVKLAIRKRPLPPPQDYHYAPPSSYYYANAPPPPYAPLPPAQFRTFPEGYAPYYSGNHYGSPSPPPMPMPPRPFLERSASYGGVPPSAPVDYSPYERIRNVPKVGSTTGMAAGTVTGALGGMTLDEGLRYEEEKASEVTSRARDGYYRDYYRGDY